MSNVTRAGQAAEPKPVHVKPFIALEKRVNIINDVRIFSVFSSYTTQGLKLITSHNVDPVGADT